MRTVITFLILAASHQAAAQVNSFESTSHRNFPVILTLQFQNLALPFKNIRGNFNNIGLGVGTEVSLNGKNNWTQQIHAVWYHNKYMGNGLSLFTQPAWRQHFGAGIYGELKFGIGYLYAYRPIKSFKQVEGNWVSAGYKGKGLLMIPAGLTLGYNKYSATTYISPFASYQFVLVKGYNKSIPVIPQTFIQIGSRIHFNYK